MTSSDLQQILVRDKIAAGPGDTTIVSAKAGFRIYVTWFYGIAAGPMNVKFKSGSTDITGPLNIAKAGNGLDPRVNEMGLMRTGVGEALVLNNDSASDSFGGVVHYFYNNI